MTGTFASPADRIAAIESLPPEVRERLGLRQSTTGEWIMRANGYEHSIESNTYADDMAILAEMEGLLSTKHNIIIVPILFGGDIYYVPSFITKINGCSVTLKLGNTVGDTPSRFSAALVAACKEVGK